VKNLLFLTTLSACTIKLSDLFVLCVCFFALGACIVCFGYLCTLSKDDKPTEKQCDTACNIVFRGFFNYSEETKNKCRKTAIDWLEAWEKSLSEDL